MGRLLSSARKKQNPARKRRGFHKPRWVEALPDTITAQKIYKLGDPAPARSIVARELAPAGARSGPKSLRLLRNRTGASSLATKAFMPRICGEQPGRK
ncbi:hypothetical protein C1X65_05190 [Pseudomonas sp. FW305-70]|nr:hypothetical protein C1X65_05190 [Pseudomonas sp. FW305-70]